MVQSELWVVLVLVLVLVLVVVLVLRGAVAVLTWSGC